MQANWIGRLCFFQAKIWCNCPFFPFSQQEMDGLPFLLNRQKDRQTDRDKTLMIGGMRNVSVVFLPRRYLQVLYMGRTVPLLLLLLLLLSPND